MTFHAGDVFSSLHKVWFGLVFVFGLVFLFALPPFQGNDEWPHWARLWSVAHGDLRCAKITGAAYATPALFGDVPGGRWRLDNLRLASVQTGSAQLFSIVGTAACAYPPPSYVLPALVARPLALGGGQVRRGGMVRAFYAARLTNWLLVSGSVLWLLLALPWARSFTLAFFGIPEVVQQSVALNNDALLFALGFVLIGMVLRPPTWRRLGVAAAVVVLMTLVKPVFALLGGLVLPGAFELWRTHPRVGWRHVTLLVALTVLPIALRKAWSAYVDFDAIIWLPPWNVHPDQQLAYLAAHPLHVFVILFAQLRDTFGHGLMQGSWTSIFGAFGPSAFEMAPVGYYLLLLALPAALYADITAPRPLPDNAPLTAGTRARRRLWWVGLAGILAIFPAVIFAMYLLFSSVGAPSVNGVQGRYYLTPLWLLAMLAIYAAKRRSTSAGHAGRAQLAAALALVLAVGSGGYALTAMIGHYWGR